LSYLLIKYSETTGTDPISAELVGMSFSVAENQAYYIPVQKKEKKRKKLLMSFARSSKMKILSKLGRT
jgi:DNA polymerase-1